MKLTRKKCEKALNKFIEGTNYFLEDKIENDNKYEIDVLNNLINEHFNSIEHLEGQIELLTKLIIEHFELKEEVECLYKNNDFLHDMIDKEYEISNFLYELLEKKGYTKHELNDLIYNFQLNNMDYSEVPKASGIVFTSDGKVGNCPSCGKLLCEIDNPTQCDKCGQDIEW